LNVGDSFAQRFPGRPVTAPLRKAAATKAAFVEQAPKHRFLHLATHGFFADESATSALDTEARARAGRAGLELDRAVAGVHPGLLSGLVFAGANADPAGGLLTALEAGDLDLRAVELVVLSACHTGEGKVAGGEGVLGLQRAFQVAGARTVVASRWAVPDAQTQRLMSGLYDRLWDRTDPASKVEALRRAQLAALRGGAAPDSPLAAVGGGPARGPDRGQGRGVRRPGGPPADRRHPYYWAAFVLSGDWR